VHVERFESAWWRTSSLLLAAEGEAVLVDPGISRDEVSRITARVEELALRVTAVLATHADWDHVCGIAAFSDAESVMGELTAQRVESGEPFLWIEKFESDNGVDTPGRPRVDRRIGVGVAHRIGPFDVESLALPGHKPDSVAYRIRALDLLAVGDHLSSVEFPFATATADYRATLAALIDLLRRDPPSRVVPGHGPDLTAAEALTIAEEDLAFLWQLHDAVEDALAKGATRDAARAAGLGVEPPRECPDDLAEMRSRNVDAQLRELLPQA
jgi:glyoxylase-like metal-dependent hydrolase (beta-lactamase superfamily II)